MLAVLTHNAEVTGSPLAGDPVHRGGRRQDGNYEERT